jgi:hypothetical protein
MKKASSKTMKQRTRNHRTRRQHRGGNPYASIFNQFKKGVQEGLQKASATPRQATPTTQTTQTTEATPGQVTQSTPTTQTTEATPGQVTQATPTTQTTEATPGQGVSYEELVQGIKDKIIQPLIYEDLGKNVFSIETFTGVSGNLLKFKEIYELVSNVMLKELTTTSAENFLKYVYGQDILSRLHILTEDSAGIPLDVLVSKYNEYHRIMKPENANLFNGGKIKKFNYWLKMREYVRTLDVNVIDELVKEIIGEDLVAHMGLHV